MSNEKGYAFHAFLRSHGIGEYSPSIPSGIGRHLNGIPKEEDLIEIPEIENFPLENLPEKIKPNEEELKKMFIETQLETILNKNNEIFLNSNSINIPNQFKSINHFINFKKELNQYYINKSKELNLSEDVIICSNLLCLNSSCPTFKYCINHINLDENYNKKQFLKK